IGDLAPTLQVEARNVTHNSTVDLDHPVRRRAVAPQPRPPSLEARSIIELRRSERSHPYSVAIARVLEEHAEITIFDLAKDKLSRDLRHGPLTLPAVTRVTLPTTGAGHGLPCRWRVRIAQLIGVVTVTASAATRHSAASPSPTCSLASVAGGGDT